MTEIWPGRANPLGAHSDGAGTNFVLWAPTAEAVLLCLYDDRGTETQVQLPECTSAVWHGYLPGVGPGQRYGFRVHGPYAPGAGRRANPAKLLVDPYARAIDGEFVLTEAVHGDHPDGGPDPRDSAPFVPRSVIVDDGFEWGGDRPPGVPWEDTIVYELHVRGFTMGHPEVPEALRGTYAGLAHPAVLGHVRDLGVTSIELLPVQHFVSEPQLLRRGLRNYWGYNTLGYFAPHAGYSSAGSRGEQVTEFKAMVKSLHAAGLEVILDVVYNHTAEGDEHGATLSFRGIDNAAYYRLDPRDRGRYTDFTGCGNTLDTRQPHVLRLLMDSLRYWVTEMHVDGFRFDLASALARGTDHVDSGSAFFSILEQDPVLNRIKLIAEPWDVGEGGYQVGRFPPLWTEWNDRYRNTVRDFWAGADGGIRELGYRLSGSSDLYRKDGRRPRASVNYVTSHDGFTVRDLVSYDDKHNEDNGEDNRDGEQHNRSWNCGIEGESTDETVRSLRQRQTRNLLATLLLSTGVPMILAGDELRRTQRGNNNAYCQDNELSYVDWALDDEAKSLLDWTARLIAFRRSSPVLRRQTFFDGNELTGLGGVKDLAWFTAAGSQMSDEDWHTGGLRTIGMYLDGRGIRPHGGSAQPAEDGSYLVVLHAGAAATTVQLPGSPWADRYEIVLDTANEAIRPDAPVLRAESVLPVTGRSVVLLRCRHDDSPQRAGTTGHH